MPRSSVHFCIIGLFLLGGGLALVRVGESVPVGIVIPHHDMVASARRAYLTEVSRATQPETIVLLSPDHFGTNQYPLVGSSRTWQTSVGKFESNLDLLVKLRIPQDAADFLREHGVTGLLRDLKTFFPHSRIVPVMVSQRAPYAAVEDFVAELYAHCSECLLVASVDFSHSSEAYVADLHDQLTLRELYQGDAQGLYNEAEVDSPQSLAALALWGKRHGYERFQLFSHTNSGHLSGNRVGEMTTHIIGGYSKGEREATLDSSVTMMFGGDVMFARVVHEHYETSPAEALTRGLGDRFFWGTDLSLINLEGVFSPGKDYREGWESLPPRLRFHPQYVAALEAARVDAVSLANNHRNDGGEDDLLFTKQLLSSRGMEAVSSQTDDEPEVLIRQQGKTKVVVMTVATHGAMRDIAPTIRRYSEAGNWVVVFVHWGDEYMGEPSADQVAMARRFVEAGADLIVGSHPHIIQTVDVYEGVPIVYSLGNLLFDQDESASTMVGLVLATEFDEQGIWVAVVPVNSFLVPKPITYDIAGHVTRWSAYRENDSEQVFYFPF